MQKKINSLTINALTNCNGMKSTYAYIWRETVEKQAGKRIGKFSDKMYSMTNASAKRLLKVLVGKSPNLVVENDHISIRYDHI